jgi:hypothetical protein
MVFTLKEGIFAVKDLLKIVFRLTFFCAGVSGASDFYLDPVNGGPQGDGSRERPFGSLQQVIESGLIQGYQCSSLPYQEGCSMTLRNGSGPIKGGDRLLLLSGYHGEITIMDSYQNEPILVEAASGHTPKILHPARQLPAEGELWYFRSW